MKLCFAICMYKNKFTKTFIKNPWWISLLTGCSVPECLLKVLSGSYNIYDLNYSPFDILLFFSSITFFLMTNFFKAYDNLQCTRIVFVLSVETQYDYESVTKNKRRKMRCHIMCVRKCLRHYNVQAALAIRGFAIRGFGTHRSFQERNPRE